MSRLIRRREELPKAAVNEAFGYTFASVCDRIVVNLMKKLSGFPTVLIPRSVVLETERLFLGFAKDSERFEGVVYWVGKETPEGFLVTEAVAPRAMMTPVSFRVNAEENARIMTKLVKKGEQIIAQVSSRPPGSDLRHHLTEEEMGFLPFEGLISVVVSDYGAEGLLPLSEKTAVFLFEKGKFVKLPTQQVTRIFKLV